MGGASEREVSLGPFTIRKAPAPPSPLRGLNSHDSWVSILGEVGVASPYVLGPHGLPPWVSTETLGGEPAGGPRTERDGLTGFLEVPGVVSTPPPSGL